LTKASFTFAIPPFTDYSGIDLENNLVYIINYSTFV